MFNKDFDPRRVKRADLAWQAGPYNRYEPPPPLIAKYADLCRMGDLPVPIDESYEMIDAEHVVAEHLAHVRE